MMLVMMLVPFGVMSAEKARPAEPPRISIQTSIQIDAPPMKVWKNLIAFPDIEEPPASLFRLGLSYPIRARITG
jgi:hypothetical protein